MPIVPKLLLAKVRVFSDLFRKTRQLELLNSELERRVEERTAELTRANAELETVCSKNGPASAKRGGPRCSRCRSSKAWASSLGTSRMNISTQFRLMAKRLLAFAMRPNLNLEAVDIPKLINGMTDMLRCLLGPTIETAVEFEDGLPPIHTDANQLELALLNVALNARDAMPDGGRFQIAGRSEDVNAGSIRGLNGGEHVCIELTDTGSGMDEATLLRASDPFFTTKELGMCAGTGSLHGL